MKKFLCFLGAAVIACGLGIWGMPKAEVLAEEPAAPIMLGQVDFAMTLANPDNAGKSYVLSEDVELMDWKPIDISGIKLDGNGFSVTVDAPLFGQVSGGSFVKNLGVKATPNFVAELEAGEQFFGLVANKVSASTFTGVFSEGARVPADVTDGELATNVYNEVAVTLNGSGYVGGMFGALDGAIVKNCYSVNCVVVSQEDENAQSTLVGGFVGHVGLGTILTNCYAVPMKAQVAKASFAHNLESTKAEIVIGGFAGGVDENVTQMCNVFAGGALPAQNTTENKSILVGRLIGDLGAVTDDNFGNIYTFNNNVGTEFVARGDVSGLNVKYMQGSTFTLINNFAPAYKIEGQMLWNEFEAWDVAKVWCKKDVSTYPVLQVFESFVVSINTEKNSEGIGVEILDQDQNVITTLVPGPDGADIEIPAVQVELKYNTPIFFKLSIGEDFKPYKVVKNLVVNNTTEVQGFGLNERLAEALVPLVVTGESSGVYFANTQDIKYSLKVVSANENQGKVRVKGATASIDSSKPFDLTYMSLQSFVAVPANNSYTFDKWVWLDGAGAEAQDAHVGNPENLKNSGQGITIKFGDSVFVGEENTFVYMTSQSVANVPSTVVDGVITFILQARFTTHNENLSIVAPIHGDNITIYISTMDVPVSGVPDLNGVSFVQRITIGKPIEIKIVVAEGYTFNGWRVTNQSLSSIIDTAAGEDEMSTTIHATFSGETTLFADIVKNDVEEVDLTWLWITLGGIGGVALLALGIWLVVRRKRQESFTDFY